MAIHTYIALKDFNERIKLIKDHEYLMSDESSKELNIEALIESNIIKEVIKGE
jgi:hypothetical protein